MIINKSGYVPPGRNKVNILRIQTVRSASNEPYVSHTQSSLLSNPQCLITLLTTIDNFILTSTLVLHKEHVCYVLNHFMLCIN